MAARVIKRRYFRVLSQEFPSLGSTPPTLRTSSYFVATVGRTTLEIIKEHVANKRRLVAPSDKWGSASAWINPEISDPIPSL